MQTPEEKLVDLDIHLSAAQATAEELTAIYADLTAAYQVILSLRKKVSELRKAHRKPPVR